MWKSLDRKGMLKIPFYIFLIIGCFFLFSLALKVYAADFGERNGNCCSDTNCSTGDCININSSGSDCGSTGYGTCCNDNDGDGYYNSSCGGSDCDDTTRLVGDLDCDEYSNVECGIGCGTAGCVVEDPTQDISIYDSDKYRVGSITTAYMKANNLASQLMSTGAPCGSVGGASVSVGVWNADSLPSDPTESIYGVSITISW